MQRRQQKKIGKMKIIGYLTLTPPDWDSLRRRSKQLLPLATEAVEMAIEKDEKTAMQWLQEQTQTNC
jgi:hypothetical protein